MLLAVVNFEDVPSLLDVTKENMVDRNMKNEIFGVEDNIKTLDLLHNFQSKIKTNFGKLEDTIFTVKYDHDIEYGSDNADLVISLLKARITSSERKISSKDGTIGFC